MSDEINSEVVVLGGGPSGYSAAFRCADLGLNTVLIERYDNLGGVCLNVGCIPSKSLLYISNMLEKIKDLELKGIKFGKPEIDLSQIQNWKKNIINGFSNGLLFLAKNRKIKVIQGIASFNTENSVFIRDDNNNLNYIINFNYSIIATGSQAIELPLFSRNDPRIWNSTDALNLSVIPDQLLIVGSGVIGLEMATIYSSFGSNVDVIDSSNQLLPSVDQDIVEVFKKCTQDKFNIILNTDLVKVNSKKDGIWIELKDNFSGKNKLVRYDAILVSIGRKPSSENLNLIEIGIKIDERGCIIVDDQLKTTIPHIFAIGDVVGPPMLAHKGIYQAHIAAEVISGKKHFFDPKVIPSVIYTSPEIAWVGITETEAKLKNIDYEASVFPWSSLGKAVLQSCDYGQTKLIFDKKSHKIIGGSILGTNAGELLGEIGLSIEMNCDVEDIALTIHAHPTLYESVSLSAQMFQGTSTDLLNKKNKF